MAQFCLATRMTPSEYRKLTILEFQEFVKALDSRHTDIQELF
jgi:hypothetical protein